MDDKNINTTAFTNNQKSKNGFFAIMTIIMVALTAVFVVFGIYNMVSGRKVKAVAQKSQKSTNVAVKVLKKEVFSEVLTLNADLKNLNPSVNVFSTVAGTIIENNVRLGDKVDKGSVLGVVDASDIGLSYAPFEIVSPIEGIVVANNAVLNQKIGISTVLYSIQGEGDFVLSSSVSESDAGVLKIGSKGAFKVAGDAGEHTCTLRYISPNVNTLSRKVEIEADVDKTNENYFNLRNGNRVSLSLVKNEYKDVYVLPNSAIKSYMGKPVVYKVENDIVKRIDVEIAFQSESYSIVNGDLKDDDRIVVQGSPSDGASVKVL